MRKILKLTSRDTNFFLGFTLDFIPYPMDHVMQLSNKVILQNPIILPDYWLYYPLASGWNNAVHFQVAPLKDRGPRW